MAPCTHLRVRVVDDKTAWLKLVERNSPGRSIPSISWHTEKRVDLVINIPKNFQEQELTNDYMIRRQAVEFGIPLITNIQLAQRFVEAIAAQLPHAR